MLPSVALLLAGPMIYGVADRLMLAMKNKKETKMTNLERACVTLIEALCEKLRTTEKRADDFELKHSEEMTKRVSAEMKVSSLESKMMSLEASLAVEKRNAEDRFQRIKELDERFEQAKKENEALLSRRRRGRRVA